MQASAMAAEAQAKVAESEARRDSLINELVRSVQERLAAVKDGADGRDGADGADGKDGEAGPQGETGAAGQDGKDGSDGRDGADGKNGEAGPQGEAGRDGERGADGRDGSDGRDGERGADGADGKSVSVLGTYDPEKEYSELDIVALNGGSFIAVKDAPGPCPGGGWQLLASRGSRGEKGDRGERGMPGDRGERGLPGRDGETPVALFMEGAELVLIMASGEELRTAITQVRK